MASLFKPVRHCLKLAKQVPKVATNFRYSSSVPSDPAKSGNNKVVDTADPKGACK